MALLEAKGVTKLFGGLVAVDSLDFVLEEGPDVQHHRAQRRRQDHFLQHPDRHLSTAKKGTIHFHGKSAFTGWRPWWPAPDQISALGIARTFQNIRLFGSMTVCENILVGMHYRSAPDPDRDAASNSSRSRRKSKRLTSGPAQLMDFVGLNEDGDELAPNLPYGGAAPGRDRPRPGLQTRSCCCWTSRPPG